VTRPPEGDIPAPRAIVFDWDNTLVDTWTTIHAALAVTFEAMEQTPWTLEETRERVRHSMRESFPKLFGDRWEEAVRTFHAAFEELHLQSLTPISGAQEMLHFLSERNILLGVVSNKTGRYLRAESAHLGWNDYFHAVVGAGDAPNDKPAIDPLLMVLEGSRIAPGKTVWFVGDAGIDMEIAYRANCIPVLMREDLPESMEFKEFQPKVHLRRCMELATYVATL
jgi:phosphoglycolate phosphatase